jgi:RNA polymerase sigma-70 factor, ECF subfamily
VGVAAQARVGRLTGGSSVVLPLPEPSRRWGLRLLSREPQGSALAEPVADASDVDLVGRIAAGDQDALGETYDRYASALYGATVRVLSDPHAAEEVVQDAFLALWNHAGRFDATRGSLSGWLFTVARNRAHDHLRRVSRRPHELGPSIDQSREEHTDDEFQRLLASGRPVGDGSAPDEPEAAAMRAWTRAVVRSLLDTMPAQQRLVLDLAYDDGLSQQEIADRLGWPLGTVKTRTRRGLLRLREALETTPGLEGIEEAAHGAR